MSKQTLQNIKQIVTRSSVAFALVSIIASFTNAFAASEERFNTSFKLLKPISITQQSDISFAELKAGKNARVTTRANDNSAIVFSASGQPNTSITATIVEDQITLVTGNGESSEKQIVVNQFTTGGNLNQNGSATFDANGQLSDLRVGATAHVLASNQAGDYTSNATFRVVYN